MDIKANEVKAKVEDIFKGYGIEVELKSDQSFLIIVETLTRIGIANNHTKHLFQTCHILHKQGRYAILHFKELFSLDGKESTLTDEDVQRRNVIVSLLAEWELLKVKNPKKIESVSKLNNVKIISAKEKREENWTLVPK